MIYLSDEARTRAINSIDKLIIAVSNSNIDYLSVGEIIYYLRILRGAIVKEYMNGK